VLVSLRDSGSESGLDGVSLGDCRELELELFSDDLARRVIASSLIFGSCRLGGEGGEYTDRGCMSRLETSCQSSGRDILGEVGRERVSLASGPSAIGPS
jgi:hypothetical protein